MARSFAILLAAIVVSYVAADSETTLIVPFADPQPISADILGVDTAQGRTTWQLRQGAFTGTWTDPQGSFPGTATLIEGADYASFTYSVAAPEGTFAVGGECSIKDGVEVCVAAEDGADGTATVTNTDTVTPFGLQIAATGAPAGGASPTSAPSGGANSGSTPAASGTASVQSGSAVRTSASSIGALAGLLFAYRLL